MDTQLGLSKTYRRLQESAEAVGKPIFTFFLSYLLLENSTEERNYIEGSCMKLFFY